MSPGYFPRRRQQNKNNEALYSHKTKPTFAMAKEEEHNPGKPCKLCFPHSNSMAEDFENLGIRNLLLLMKNKEVDPRAATWAKILLKNFKSVQIHAGQIEKILQVKTRKVYVASHHNLWDEPILDYVLISCLQENVLFFNQPSNILMKLNEKTYVNTDSNHVYKTSAQEDESATVLIFINLDSQNEGDLLNVLCNQVNQNDAFEVSLIPVSISYEFLPVLPNERLSNQRKPHVRINFGHIHSFNKDIKERKDKPNAVSDLRQHMLHEIWKNTAIMSSHVFSMLHRYRPNFSTSQFSVWLDDFQKEFRFFYDLGFVGDINDIAAYTTLEMLSLKELVNPSMAIDLIKYDSIMMKSLTMVMDEAAIDFRSETCRISQNQMLEKFRLLIKILRYEIDYIYPTCIPHFRVEQNILERLFQRSVASPHSSEMDSEEQAKAKRLARHLDIDFDEEGDSDYAPQSFELPLFVNIPSVISRKWVVGITNSLLEVYYVAARQLLELRKVDAMEDVVFFDRVCDAMKVLIDVKTSVAELNCTLQNVLKLFEDEGILQCYQHSGAKVIYMKDPFNEGPILEFIQNVAQFIY